MFNQPQNIDFDPETTTCCFAHPQMEGVFFCNESPNGLTQDISQATKYMGQKSRERGLVTMKERFPQIKDGKVIFHYIPG